MATKQGSLELLKDPVAQKLLHSNIPARLAYVWKDGSPRVVAMGFYWTGSQIVVGTGTTYPKYKVIDGKKVAITIDSNEFPFKVLSIRGTAHTTIADGIPLEYKLGTKQLLGEEAGEAFLKQVEPLDVTWVRIAITPEWVGILDFETRFPNELEKAMGMG